MEHRRLELLRRLVLERMWINLLLRCHVVHVDRCSRVVDDILRLSQKSGLKSRIPSLPLVQQKLKWHAMNLHTDTHEYGIFMGMRMQIHGLQFELFLNQR